MSTHIVTETAASVAIAGLGPTWNNTGNAIDGNPSTYADSTVTSNANTRSLAFSDFGFAIPDDATLIDFKVSVYTHAVQVGSKTADNDQVVVTLYDNTTIIGGTDAREVITVDQSDSIEGPYLYELIKDNWTDPNAFLSLTPADFNASTFTIRVQMTNDGNDTTSTEYRLYSAEVEITYSVVDPVSETNERAFHKTSSIARNANGIFKY